MTTNSAEVLLGSGNDFHWEYNMRVMLAHKGLLAHVEEVNVESEITEAWHVNDAKALGIIAQGMELQHQVKIPSARRAIEASGTIREFYNRTTLHNRVTMTRRLHEFKTDDGASMAAHMTLHRCELLEYEARDSGMAVMIADDKKLTVAGLLLEEEERSGLQA
ncbi:unnamed protein product [Phytophthora fragariaefolia]|uniref:Unnamed protein product n=1 Tax=Phytophthora fragariaefolia TaxID=1490495 RepID=A0A9W6X6F5_9STRA|nr:unnamed protein product [Phytophthora fragariaefolia]